MAKFHGIIGYVENGTVETSPGVWSSKIIERKYRGEFIQNTFVLQETDQVNDNLNVSNKISIVADLYANENFHLMRYVVLGGAKWKIKSVEPKRPRLILTIGGVYNGE